MTFRKFGLLIPYTSDDYQLKNIPVNCVTSTSYGSRFITLKSENIFGNVG